MPNNIHDVIDVVTNNLCTKAQPINNRGRSKAQPTDTTHQQGPDERGFEFHSLLLFPNISKILTKQVKIIMIRDFGAFPGPYFAKDVISGFDKRLTGHDEWV